MNIGNCRESSCCCCVTLRNWKHVNKELETRDYDLCFVRGKGLHICSYGCPVDVIAEIRDLLGNVCWCVFVNAELNFNLISLKITRNQMTFAQLRHRYQVKAAKLLSISQVHVFSYSLLKELLQTAPMYKCYRLEEIISGTHIPY